MIGVLWNIVRGFQISDQAIRSNLNTTKLFKIITQNSTYIHFNNVDLRESW